MRGQSFRAAKDSVMIYQELLEELDIISDDDFRYPEQFIAAMETDSPLDYDTFAELLAMASSEHLSGMVDAFYEDLIRGIPDDNMDLYGAVQTFREAMVSLSGCAGGRSIGFLTDELFNFREWYTTPETIVCIPEGGGDPRYLSPLEALMLYREEKLSGDKFIYDFNSHMPPDPDEYVYDLLYELELESDRGTRYTDEDDDYPDELPPDFDPTDYDPDDPTPFGTIDPYRDGFIDRYDPVVEGFGLDPYGTPEEFREE